MQEAAAGHGENDRAPDEVTEALERGRLAAENALKILLPPRKGASTYSAIARNATSFTAAPTAAIYWRALIMKRRASLAGYAESVVASEEVAEDMAYCLETAPDLDHGGPLRHFGTAHARPAFFEHRDLARSKEFFERAIETAPGYLGNRVGLARDYAVMAQDRETFEAQLTAVREADANGA